MRFEIEFSYAVEVRAPSVRRPDEYVRPVMTWLYGRETIEMREVSERELPVALRYDANEVLRTDGERLLSKTSFDITDLMYRWADAYSNNDCPWLLRRWFGDGEKVDMDWCPISEHYFPTPPDGSMVWDDRDAAVERLHQMAADSVVMDDGSIWRRTGWQTVTVLSPGSRRPNRGSAITRVPRVVALRGTGGPEDLKWMEACAARDLLFYPGEEAPAHERALGLGKRGVELNRKWEIEELPPYPDFSALSMVSWAKLMRSHVAMDEAPTSWPLTISELPEDQCREVGPTEIIEPIRLLLELADGPATTRELMTAFSAIAAAFRSTIEMNKLAERSDIADLLEVHGSILRRAELRPDRRAAARLSEVDELALEGFSVDEGEVPSFRGP